MPTAMHLSLEWTTEEIVYQYVTRRLLGNASRCSPGFYANVRTDAGKRSLSGPYPSQRKAAAAAAENRGEKVADIRMLQPAPPRSMRSIYLHVSFHAGKDGWVVQVGGKTVGGVFPGQEEAAEKAADVTGLSKEALEAGRSVGGGSSRSHLIARQQAWMHIYDGAKELPGDVEEMFRHIKLSKRMFRDEMALEILSIMGKYGPWKTALLQSYNMLAGSRSRVRGGRLKVAKSSRLGQRATFIRQVCLGALAACANRAEEFDPWVANVGMNMTFCSGSGRTTNVPLQVINR